MKHMVDLFSGLGGASEAMAQDSNWNVLRIENNPLLSGVPFTYLADVKNIRNNVQSNWIVPKIDLVWASPPCTEFSNAYSAPRAIAARAGKIDEYSPDMSLLQAAMDIIETVKPKYWVIENVVGSIRYFAEYLGEPRQIIGPYVLWGNFPKIYPKNIAKKSEKDTHYKDPLRSNARAKVDFELSKALKEAIEQQMSILDY
tara:strand:+ start:1424 stop:2023 length:600 start_codon:yes stop_codon:yes gene_type:complete